MEFFEEFERRFGEHIHILDWSLHLDESTPHIHERHVFDCENRYGEIAPQQEKALEALGFDLPDPSQKASKLNNRKKTFDAACRAMLFDICKRHGLHLDEEPEYGGYDEEPEYGEYADEDEEPEYNGRADYEDEDEDEEGDDESEEELSEEDKLTVYRARKIERFLSQPFSVAEQFTGVPGSYVPIQETIRGFKAIISDQMDSFPEAAFFNVGTIDEVAEKAKRIHREASET
jgi:hypothetical protein